MRLTIVGCGSRGSKLAEAADKMMEVKRIYLVDEDKARAEALAATVNKAEVVEDVEEELYHCDLVIECATQAAARQVIPKVVARGVDIMIMSVGALVDDDFREAVTEKAKMCDSKIYIPSGAIAGTDGLRAAHIDELESVELITTKGPKSLAHVKYCEDNNINVDKYDSPTVIYNGTAREAVKDFPKNINVAATVSLLGVGFDRTHVKIILDPAATVNSHELRIKGKFGEMVCHTYNLPSPDNPKTSYLASLSAISALKRIIRKQWIGI